MDGPLFGGRILCAQVVATTETTGASGRETWRRRRIGEADLFLRRWISSAAADELSGRIASESAAVAVLGNGMNVATASPMSATCCEGSTFQLARKSGTHCVSHPHQCERRRG